MQSTIQGVGTAATAQTPKSTRRMNPKAMHMTSAMTAFLSRIEYSTFSTKYALRAMRQGSPR